MAAHLSNSALERFPEREASTDQLVREVLHLEQCQECRQRWREIVRYRRGREPDHLSGPRHKTAPVSTSGGQITLRPAAQRPLDLPVDWEWLEWIADEHLTAAEVVQYASPTPVSGKLEDPQDLQDRQDRREMLTLHVRLCASCREAVQMERLSLGRGRRIRVAIGSALLSLLLVIVGLWVLVVSDQQRQHPMPASDKGAVSQASPDPTDDSPTRQTDGNEGDDGHQRFPAEDSPRLTLLDGGRRVVLRASGALSGLDELSAEERTMIAQTLLTGELPDPGIADLIVGEPPRLRAPGPLETRPHPTIGLLEPPASVIISTLPIFRWAPERAVTGWMVELAQVGGGRKLTSPVLIPSTHRWQPAEALRRGTTWRATLRGRTQKRELVSSPRKFRILGERELLWLEDLRRKTSSHLARGLAYARLGLIPEAINELERLDADNPDNILIKRFLLRLMAESAP